MKVVDLIDNEASVKALEEAERLLQTNPADQTYRFLKMIALWENGEDKEEESLKLLEELSYEQPAFAPAVYRLAGVVSEENPKRRSNFTNSTHNSSHTTFVAIVASQRFTRR